MIYGRQSNASGGEYLPTEFILWLFVITPQASRLVRALGADLTNLCPDVCVKDSETDPF